MLSSYFRVDTGHQNLEVERIIFLRTMPLYKRNDLRHTIHLLNKRRRQM